MWEREPRVNSIHEQPDRSGDVPRSGPVSTPGPAMGDGHRATQDRAGTLRADAIADRLPSGDLRKAAYKAGGSIKFSALVASELDEDGWADPVWATLREQIDVNVLARLSIKGEPASKSRPRFTGENAKKRAYTPEKVKQAEEIIAWHFRRERPDWTTPDPDGAFGVFAIFFAGNRQRRDVDNMIKLVLDACNGVVWKDDAQVSEVTGRITRGVEDPRTEIIIYRSWDLGGPAVSDRKCAHCGNVFRGYPSQGQKFCSADCRNTHRKDRQRRNCPTCGTEFFAIKASEGRFCSKECSYASKRAEVVCTHCAQTFTKQRCHVRATNYCSAECRDLEMQARLTRSRKNAQGTCRSCGGPTSKKGYRQCQACQLSGLNTPGRPKAVQQ